MNQKVLFVSGIWVSMLPVKVGVKILKWLRHLKKAH